MSNLNARKWIDTMTRRVSAFPCFEDLVTAGGNYRPSLKVSQGPESDEFRLAEIYDRVQEVRGDDRRAFRY